jgi:hypothetical protein
MGQDTYKNITIAFLLFGLFTVLIVTAVYEMSFNYGVPSEKLNEATAGALDIDSYEAELLTSDQSAENFRQRFESGDVDDVDDASGVFAVAGDLIGVITTPFNLLAKVGKNILGAPDVVTHTFLAILNIIIILGIWRLLRAGD